MGPNYTYYASEYTLEQVNTNILELNTSINAFNSTVSILFSVLIISVLVKAIEGFFDTCLNSRK